MHSTWTVAFVSNYACNQKKKKNRKKENAKEENTYAESKQALSDHETINCYNFFFFLA